MGIKVNNILPSFFATAKRDVVARYAAGALGGAIVAWAAGWASARGWYVPSKDILDMMAQGLGGVILVVVATKLGVDAVDKSEKAVVNNTVRAAITGEVPQVIAEKATATQRDHIEASPNSIVVAVPPMPAVKVE